MPQYAINIDTRAAVHRLEGVHGFMRGSITKRFRALGRSLRNELRTEIPKRTGRARRAIFSRLERKRRRNDVTLLVGANLSKAPYLKVLELGAMIRPTPGTKLAIPIGRALSGRGVAKFSAAALKANPGAFGYAKTWVSKDVVLGERSSGRIDPLFALKGQVLIRRGHYFKNKKQQRRPQILAAGREAVRDGLKLSVQRG